MILEYLIVNASGESVKVRWRAFRAFIVTGIGQPDTVREFCPTWMVNFFPKRVPQP
jgi:hypothetical protein